MWGHFLLFNKTNDFVLKFQDDDTTDQQLRLFKCAFSCNEMINLFEKYRFKCRMSYFPVTDDECVSQSECPY